jgi:hypothetical protein
LNGFATYSDAMLTRISRRPSSSIVDATAFPQACSLVTSACTANARRPSARTAAAVASASARERL